MKSAADLAQGLNEVAGHLNAQHARLVDAAIEMLANEQWWCDESVPTAAKYLTWRTAISPERAAQVITVAGRADELPACMAKFRAGELSLDQMAPIAKRVPWWADVEVAGLAPMLTVQQVRTLVAKYSFPVLPRPDETEPVSIAEASDDGADHVDANDAPSDHEDALGDVGDRDGAGDGDGTDGGSTEGAGGEATSGPPGDGGRGETPGESLWWGWDDDGRFRIHGTLDPDTGLVVEAALRESRDRLFAESTASVSWPDALRDIAGRSLDAIDTPARRDRYRVHLHLDTDGTLTDHHGRWLPEAVRQHIGCDGTISPVFYENAIPIGVGRRQHIVPPRTRRAVMLRDHGACRVPGCGNATFVEIHHIIHWEDGGESETDNLICLCPHHHRMHHRGALGIAGDADVTDGVVFTNRHGQPIPASGARPLPPGAPPDPPTGDFRHPLGEPLDTRWVYFNPPRHLRPVG